ncbi:MAG: tetratricopeptide repeat protein [Anaerolineae bacterium]|nr:tetratricopeptide repeat protein [Anaerolineae bacterium]
MYIRRDKSNLHFGRQARRRGSGTFLVVWLIVMALVMAVIWRFNTVQNWVLASVGADPTTTPDAVTLARLGERTYLAGDLEASIGYYGHAAQLMPDNIDILFEYGRMLIYRSYAGRSFAFRAEQALAVAEQAVEADPNNARAQALLCIALLENDRTDEAITAGLRAQDLAPTYAEARAYLSMAYRGAGRPNQAFAKADEAVELNSDSLDARRALAMSLAYVGEYDAAVQQYERAIQIHPRFDALYFELAAYYKAQSNYDAAIDAYDAILKMESDNVKAYTRKCETFFTMREDQLAQEACEQAIQLDPTYPEAWRQLGMVQYTRRNFEGTIESLELCSQLQTEQAVPLEEQEIECYYIRGLAHALLARCDEAWPVLQTALEMNPPENIKGFINEGLMLCVDNTDDYSIDDVPTAIPPTPIPPEPIGIF